MTDTRVSRDDQALDQLRADHLGHRIWRSVREVDGLLGDWVATLHDPAVGVEATVICRTADELRVALAAERVRAAKARDGVRR